MVTKPLAVLLLFAVLTASGAFQSTQTAATTLRVRGTIERYDPSTRTLSVSTSNGTVRFPLATTARIRQGWRQIDAATLEKLSGYRADVHYSESAGHKTVESVHVGGKAKG